MVIIFPEPKQFIELLIYLKFQWSVNLAMLWVVPLAPLLTSISTIGFNKVFFTRDKIILIIVGMAEISQGKLTGRTSTMLIFQGCCSTTP